jgi:hypothetical protein
MAIVEALYQAFGDLNVSSAAEESCQEVHAHFVGTWCIAPCFRGAGCDHLDVIDVFLGLLVLLVVAAAVLWPRSGRGDRGELELERPRVGPIAWICQQVQPPPAQTSVRSALPKATHAATAF